MQPNIIIVTHIGPRKTLWKVPAVQLQLTT